MNDFPKRKAISKKIRAEVYAKCNGRCAYCGCELEMKEMQVDHLISVYKEQYETRLGNSIAGNHIDNLMPSCRQCNFYKGANNLELFRMQLQTLMKRVKKPLQYRLAHKYGMVQETEWDGKFYFEHLQEKQSNK